MEPLNDQNSELILGEEEDNLEDDIQDYVSHPSTSGSNIELEQPILPGSELIKRKKPSLTNSFIRPYMGKNNQIEKDIENKKTINKIKSNYIQYMKTLRQQNIEKYNNISKLNNSSSDNSK